MRRIIVSKTLHGLEWENCSLVQENVEAEIRRLKREPGKEMAIFGSGAIVTELAEPGLIDE